jgi:hypothetical protein
MMAWTYPMLPKRFPANLGCRSRRRPLHVRAGFLAPTASRFRPFSGSWHAMGIDDFRYLGDAPRTRFESHAAVPTALR